MFELECRTLLIKDVRRICVFISFIDKERHRDRERNDNGERNEDNV